MNTITYKTLKELYLNNEVAKETAKDVFGGTQPLIHATGYYSSPSMNWGYVIGIVGVGDKWYEVVTQFGVVKAAHEIYLPRMEAK